MNFPNVGRFVSRHRRVPDVALLSLHREHIGAEGPPGTVNRDLLHLLLLLAAPWFMVLQLMQKGIVLFTVTALVGFLLHYTGLLPHLLVFGHHSPLLLRLPGLRPLLLVLSLSCPWSATMSFVHCSLFTVHWILLYTPPSYLLGHTGHCTDIVQHSYICVSDTFHIIGGIYFGLVCNSRNGGFSLEEPRPIVLA